MTKKYLNKNLSVKERAQDLLSLLSLEEKMAQTRCAFPGTGNSDKLIEDCRFGIGEISTLEIRNLKSLEEAAAFQKNIQDMVMKNSPHHIPAIFHMEGLCGAFIQGAVSFPSGIGRASSFDPELEEQAAAVVAKLTAKIQPWRLLWGLLIPRGYRKKRQRDFVQNPSRSIGWAFIIQKEVSTVLPVIRHGGF